jgi:hypothetical protein
VIQAEGKRKEVVTLYNKKTDATTTVSTKDVKEVVKTYSKETTTPSGEVVYMSNDVTDLTTKFNDFKFVLEETKSVTTDIDFENINVAVVPRDTVNVYTIETVKKDEKVTVELNYDIVTNRTYVTKYDSKPLPVIVPVRPVYFPEVLLPEEKVNFIDIVRGCDSADVASVINVVSSNTVTHPLYKETVLKVETRANDLFVRVIVENGQKDYQCV